MPERRFIVELTDAADADFDKIFEWTLQNFGQTQAHRYAATLHTAIERLTENAVPPDAKERRDLGADIYTLHIAGRGRRGRHWLVYSRRKNNEILIVRILHDSMDIKRRLPSNDE